MATQTVTIPCSQFAMVDGNQPRANFHGAEIYRIYIRNSAEKRDPLMSFGPVPDNITRRRLVSTDLQLTLVVGSEGIRVQFWTKSLAASFDQNTVTYDTRPERKTFSWPVLIFDWVGQKTVTLQMYGAGTDDGAKRAVELLTQPGFTCYATYPDTYLDLYSNAAPAALQPALVVTYDDSETIIPSQIAASNAPTGGYINPRNAISFAWAYSITEPDYCVADTVTQASATFYWREGSSGDFTAIPIAGDALSVAITANTFPINSSIEWYVEGTDTFGSTSQTPVYTVSTTAALVKSQPISPVGTVEDGSDVIRLQWQAQSNDGYPQTGYSILYKSQGDSNFTTLVTADGAVDYYDVPAGTFLPGTIIWGVNLKNIDGNWSSGNPTARFVNVAAPSAPIVTAQAVPFATVNWQAEGQQAYRVTVDGKTYGPYFGAGKTFAVPDYLTDGEHTVTVAVQGVYGLWSQDGTVTFTVRNVQGDPVTLRGSFDRDAALSWQTASQTADFLIYRDGVQIGHASGDAFADRFVLGAHSYRVINRLPDGNYTASNIVTGTMRSCTAAIALLAGGAWIELRLSENSNREEAFSWSRTVSMRHFAGAEYPVAETSPFADQAGSYDVSFIDLPSAQAFEALRGQAVILKSRGGNVMVGVLANLSKRMTEFYIAYTFTLQRMHWRDYVDADG